jgi:Glucose / Sorbosone dehydrogenase
MATGTIGRRLATLLFWSLAPIWMSRAAAQPITTDIHVKLRPVVEKIDLVTDINVVGQSLFVSTQPGLLLRKSLASRSTTDFTVFLDLRHKVGPLGARIPELAGLGYPVAGTYDERGLLGFAADPAFASNGRFWVWYTAIDEHSASPPGFFQWLVSTSDPWDQSQYDHVGHLAEYQVVNGTPVFRRTLLLVKRPYFNHTGFSSLVWSPEFETLTLGLGDGGSEYDPNNIAQDDDQLSGKLLKIDLDKLRGRDVTGTAPVATFSDLRRAHVPSGAFTPLVKGMRNPSKTSFEQLDGGRWLKYLANTGQDTIEFAHAFVDYGINFGFRPWEGIFPTAFEQDDARVIAYGLEASRMPNIYRPFVEYTHLDPDLGPNANTGSTLYRGNGIPGLKGQLVFTDWISFVMTPRQGLLMHAAADRAHLQRAQPVHRMAVNFSEVGLKPGGAIFYTAINTDEDGDRLFVGAFKDVQFIVNQRNNPLGSDGLAGGVYEVVKE